MPYVPFPTSDTENSFTIRGPFQLPSSDYNQAMAELDAREANPRSGIPDDQLAQLTLERALAEQLSPFNVGLELGARSITEGRAITPRESYIKSGSTVLQRDPLTGALKTVFSEQPKPGLSTLEKARLADIQAQLKQEYAQYAKAITDEEKGAHARTIRGLRAQMEALATQQAPVAAAAMISPWQINPESIPIGEVSTPEQANDLSMFGKLGARTPFMFSGASAPPPVMPGRRVGRFNILQKPLK